jgi:predicted TPR repeat methyltransferase
VYNNLGLLQARRGNLALAEAAYRHALSLAPDADYILGNYATLLMRLKRYEEATSFSIKAVKMDPADPRARRTLSICYALVGDMAASRRALQEWLDMDPGNPEALHLMAAAGGLPTPERATDAYIVSEFDAFSRTFDAKLEQLGYRAPELLGRALHTVLAQALGGPAGPGAAGQVLDAGCGTGLCALQLRPLAQRLDGVDLSQGMLDRAADRGGYDSLTCAELGAHILAHPGHWDTIVSADTLCYFGDLRAVISGCAAALRPGGHLLFSVEAVDTAPDGYVLHHHGRYAHARAYVQACVQAAGLQLVSLVPDVLRHEVLRPVQGWVVTARAA